MKKEQWHPVHYAIILFGVFMLMMVYQMSEYKRQQRIILNKYIDPDTTNIDQSHNDYLDFIDPNALIINGDTLANENI